MLPIVGSINRLIRRTNVDLPLPDKPIITKISPCSTENEAWLTPTVHPVSFRMASLDLPSFSSFNACFVFFPNTFVNFSTWMIDISFTSFF